MRSYSSYSSRQYPPLHNSADVQAATLGKLSVPSTIADIDVSPYEIVPQSSTCKQKGTCRMKLPFICGARDPSASPGLPVRTEFKRSQLTN